MGKRGPKVDKLWGDALRVAVMRPTQEGSDRVWLAEIAEQCVKAAAAGDIQAIKEIGDRLDGKPKQTTDITTRNGDLADLLEEIADEGLTIHDERTGTAGATAKPH